MIINFNVVAFTPLVFVVKAQQYESFHDFRRGTILHDTLDLNVYAGNKVMKAC